MTLLMGAGLLLIGAAAVGFYMAWTIGANDVANAMGTAVGSGTLNLKQAILIAGIFEFLGAVLVGAHVTSTLKGGIVDPSYFQGQGDAAMYLVMYGMLAALLGAALWVTIATYFALPVSTSHSIVGALLGFGLTAVALGKVGLSAISFGKVGEIALSWVLSPLLGVLFAFIIFNGLKKHVIYSDEPLRAARGVVPYIVMLIFAIVVYSVLHEGLPNYGINLSLPEILGISTIVGVSAGVIGYWRLRRQRRGVIADATDELAQAEKLFGSLLILACSYIAFAHGANNVGNAIGPVTAIIAIATTGGGTLTSNTVVPFWALLIGGLGLFIGVATWGYKVIETIGKRITEITPTGGFTVTFSAATITLLCTYLGYPASVSHIVVGCVTGVGLAGGIGALDLRVIGKIIISWVVTIPVAAGIAALLYLGIVNVVGF